VKGEVTSVDCSEFPCLVHGKISSADGVAGAKRDFEKVRGLTALSYSGSDFYASTSDFEGKPGEPSQEFFTLSYYPKLADPEKAAIGARMRLRKNQFMDASR
jgi:hypothetical protein